MCENNLLTSILVRSLTRQHSFICAHFVITLYVRMNGNTAPASSSPATSMSMSTVQMSPFFGLSRLSQEDIAQITTAVAGLIRPRLCLWWSHLCHSRRTLCKCHPVPSLAQ